MKFIRLEEPGRLTLLEGIPPDAPFPEQATVRVHRVGICGTDLHAFAGNQPFFSYPRILGHELGVEVISVGDRVTNVKPGDRCSVEPYLNCGKCIACRSGRPNCCSGLRVLGVHIDGGLCEMLSLPARKLHPSTELTFDQLALVETLAIGCHALARARPIPDEFVLVIGAGPIGLAVIQFAVESGARVIVLDVNRKRLEFCKNNLGISDLIDGSIEQPLERLKTITDGDLPTVVIDATGNPNSMMKSFDFPAPGGRMVFVGLCQGDICFNDANFHRRELTLMASRNALPKDFTKIIQLISSNRIDTMPWITHRPRLDEVVDVFPALLRQDTNVVKAMIEI
jgi:2-desacetyl-2-hydroxyethyl bacteriochlorophyllide A dehydrogenase